MAGQLLPPPGSEPALPDEMPVSLRIAAWVDLMDFSEQMLLGGLRREIGPEGDLTAAYRAWHKQRMQEHDQAMFHLMSELQRREGNHAG